MKTQTSLSKDPLKQRTGIVKTQPSIHIHSDQSWRKGICYYKSFKLYTSEENLRQNSLTKICLRTFSFAARVKVTV